MADANDNTGGGCAGCFLLILLIALGIFSIFWILEPNRKIADSEAYNDGWVAGKTGMPRDKDPFINNRRKSASKLWNAGYDAGSAKEAP